MARAFGVNLAETAVLNYPVRVVLGQINVITSGGGPSNGNTISSIVGMIPTLLVVRLVVAGYGRGVTGATTAHDASGIMRC